MRIPLTGSAEVRRSFRHRGPASQYLDDSATFYGDIFVRAEVSREGGMLHLDLAADLPGQFTCDRCGQSFQRQHSVSDDFFFSFAPSAAARQDPEVPVIPRGATELDVSQEIRDLVLLNLPFQVFCSPDCKGLCPRCGANLNSESCRCAEAEADPRWEALRGLRRGNA
jgi:uncharacterized protein